MQVVVWLIVTIAITMVSCGGSTESAPDVPTSPSVLVPNVNYAGEWAGGWRTTSCVDLRSDFRYCANNVRRDFEPMRLNLTQSGPRISGTIQTLAGQGTVGGVVDDLGRLRIGGMIMSVAARGVPASPRTRVVRWRTTVTPEGYLIGGLVLDHLAGDLENPAATAVAELTDTLVRKCAGPKFSGVFWEC